MTQMASALVLPLLAGLALFLFGMKVVELALFHWTGDWMRRALLRLTSTPLRGLVTGTATTAVLQSSSAVTVMTIGFVNAGVMTFPQTLGIILGTNIGSCLTTELIGANMTGGALPVLLACSGIWLATWLPMRALARWTSFSRVIGIVRLLSLSVAGFCCILLGLHVMQTIVPYLERHGLLAWFVNQSQQSLLWGIVAGAALTAIVHSSSASIAITMGLASLGVIPLDLGIAIVLGSNVGTCATALVAGIGGSRFGHYVAWTHLILNIGGAALFYPFIHHLSALSAWFTESPSEQIARAQTIFNIVCSLLALPICYLPVFKQAQ